VLPPFGRTAASALVKGVAWAAHHDRGAALFFATLDRLEGIDAILPAADRAIALAACARERAPSDDADVATLATLAQLDAESHGAALVTPSSLLAVAAREAGASLDRALARVGVDRAQLMQTIETSANRDEAPGPRSRYVVVVRGHDFLDASNTYQTLSDARRVRAALRERAFGIPMGIRDRADPTPFWLRIPERIAEATDVTIRDLEAT
jgi:hypothetical protein